MIGRILILFLISLSSLPAKSDEINVKPKQPFSVFVGTLQAPDSEGWILAEKASLKIQFTRKPEGLLAQAAFFDFRHPYDKASLLAVAKDNVTSNAEAAGGKSTNATFSYTDKQGFPCVRANHTMQLNEHVFLQQHFLLCVPSKYKNLGLMVAFSYPGKKSISRLDEEAEKFLSGIKIKGYE